MTFEKVDEAMGQTEPGSNYAVKVQLKCNLDTAEQVRIDRTTKKRSQQVYITDNQGRQSKVKIVGKSPDLTTFVGQQLDFELSAYISTYDDLTYYSGFCNVPQQQGQPQGAQQQGQRQRPQQGVQQQQRPQQRQQAQQRPRQAQAAPRDYDKENRGKCRFGFYQALLQAGVEPGTLNEEVLILEAVEELVEKAMNGIGDNLDKPAPKQTMKEAINDAEAHRDSRYPDLDMSRPGPNPPDVPNQPADDSEIPF